MQPPLAWKRSLLWLQHAFRVDLPAGSRNKVEAEAVQCGIKQVISLC